MGRAPGGLTWSIDHGRDVVEVVEVGGALRSWRHDDREVLAGFDADGPITAGRGQQLLPWPNRLRDGKYSFGGRDRQLPITEVALGNASHGLVRWVPWQLVDSGHSHVTVGVTLHPQPGWDWTFACSTTYAVGPLGLAVTSVVTNLSDSPAPLGAGWHPYLSIDREPIEGVRLTVPASSYVEVDERLLPVETVPVTGTVYDFRSSRSIGSVQLDTAFTGLDPGDDGRWRVRVETPGQVALALWGQQSAFPWVQIFTGKAQPDQAVPWGIAVEPMSCPANALATGVGLVVLEPDQSWTGSWGVDTPVSIEQTPRP